MKKSIALTGALLLSTACANAQPQEFKPAIATSGPAGEKIEKADAVWEGMVVKPSAFDVDVTADRLTKALEKKGAIVMARINHAENARKADLELAPTTLIIFGNPRAGTQLMKAAPTAAIDLPMKALIYERNGLVYLAYNTPDYIAERHRIDQSMPVLGNMKALLASVARQATEQD